VSAKGEKRGARELRFEAVGVRIGGKTIVADVSFEVHPGEVVGLVGHNGAGKTSLLRAATRTLELATGAIRLGEDRVSDLSRRALARALATVPQDTQINFPFSAAEVVLMGRAPHQPLFGLESPEDLRRAHGAMERMGIAELANRTIGTLSGGERQLVMFARALAQQPELLLLDEPTTFLDLRHRLDVLRSVRDLADQGGGALVISHDLGLASRVCDRLVVLAAGRVIAQGSPAAVLIPDVLREAFGIDADLLRAPDGSPVVVPRIPPRNAG